MAKNNTTSKASRVASSSKKNPSSSSRGNHRDKKNTPTEQEPKRDIPVRLISSLIVLALFLLFGVIFFNPDGAIIGLMYKLLLGLFGKVAFYVSIPALLYLFFIHAFSGKRPIVMRSICLGVFVILCGVFHEMVLLHGTSSKQFIPLGELYNGGIASTHAGILCGSIAMLTRWLIGNTLTYIVLLVAGILTLLGSMHITIPSIVRAVRNRPRADWEDEELEESADPAAVVVNHFAQKRINHIEKRRSAQEFAEEESFDYKEPPKKEKKKRTNSRGEDIMRQIDTAVEAPVAASEKRVTESQDDSIFSPVGSAQPKKNLVDNIPRDMPALDMEDVAADVGASVTEMQEEAKPAPEPQKVTAQDAAESAEKVAAEIEENAQMEKPVYQFPPISLLKHASKSVGDISAEMRDNARRLNEALESFKIDAHISNVIRGPSITCYEVELEKGVRMSKLTSISDDIALVLGTRGVRISPVLNKCSTVAIEVPNTIVSKVSLREVVDSSVFRDASAKSTFAVGKDIGDNPIISNMTSLPHMLIAGTTGSGKSVCMNSIIVSLLYKASPEDLKLIMIDPKMVELGIYNSIPHLLIPVITDPKKAAGSLQWAVTEMMRRYNAMSLLGVREWESYNTIIENEEGEKIPQIVVIIDELADLMMTAAKEVEDSICRLTQMGRAAGIHVIIATQRPSADVITGLMKANIPSRIAFSVASAMESRIILDAVGAEKLVGKGDMIFSPADSDKILRVQGCYVSDAEVEAVTTFIKENFKATFDKKIIADIDKRAAQTGNNKHTGFDAEPNADELGGDEMLPAAVDVILETGQASVSMLQRRLKLGYARAARIVDEMQEKGIVGPYQGSKPRNILVTKEQWEAMKNGQPKQLGFEDLQDDDTDPVPDEID